jgi:hypothetical protein
MIRNVLIAGALLLPLASLTAPAYAEENHGCSVASQATGDDAKATTACPETRARAEETRVQEAMRSSRDDIVGHEERGHEQGEE